MSDFNSIAHTVAAAALAGAARAIEFLVGGAAILLVMTLWFALLWCCRLFNRDRRAAAAHCR